MTLRHLERLDSVDDSKVTSKNFVVCDNVCVCSETLLTPFSVIEKNDPAKDAFNFYLSQMRIHIEQTFGIMTENGEFYVRHFRHAQKIVGK